jgi:hypothetical protein
MPVNGGDLSVAQAAKWRVSMNNMKSWLGCMAVGAMLCSVGLAMTTELRPEPLDRTFHEDGKQELGSREEGQILRVIVVGGGGGGVEARQSLGLPGLAREVDQALYRSLK